MEEKGNGATTPIKKDGAVETSDEYLKLRLKGKGEDPRVCNGVIQINEDRKLTHSFGENYFQPTRLEVEEFRNEIRDFCHDSPPDIIIPMHEKGSEVSSVLNYLTGIMAEPKNIIVVNDRSSQKAIQTVQRFDVTLVDRDDLLDMIKWRELFPILGINQRPYSKGVAVLAGYLLTYLKTKLLDRKIVWVFQHDAEIEQCDKYSSLEYLVWGILNSGDKDIFKIAKWGRNNEISMAARNAAYIISRIDSLDEKVRKQAEMLFLRMVGHKWMLTGEFGMEFSKAMERSFLSGYLEETFMSMIFPFNKVVQIANPNPRLDLCNEYRKEFVMMQTISNFIIWMCLSDTFNPDNITIDSIANINNKGVLSGSFKIGWIPVGEEPVWRRSYK